MSNRQIDKSTYELISDPGFTGNAAIVDDIKDLLWYLNTKSLLYMFGDKDRFEGFMNRCYEIREKVVERLEHT